MSGATKDDVFRLAGFIEDDLRGVNAKFTELRSMLAQGAMTRSAENNLSCKRCGVVLKGPIALRDHLVNVHGEEVANSR